MNRKSRMMGERGRFGNEKETKKKKLRGMSNSTKKNSTELENGNKLIHVIRVEHQICSGILLLVTKILVGASEGK